MVDGRVKHVQERCESEFDANGKPLRSVGTVQDITDRWEAEERLRISLAEKETLLREIHHRVKNNLQIISSLLHFQSRKAKGAENLAVFQEGRDRLKSMILVHEKLYQSQNLSRIEFGDYARSLLEEIGVSYRDSAKAMTLKVEAVAVYLPIETALPLGMLLSELATNVFKYAYPDGRGGELRVTVAGADGQLQLVVADDGAGLPERVNPEAPESFGLRLVANLATQLGGSVRYARGAGLSVEVRVPLANAQDGAEERAA
jgi:two-component sensor histidine kinase